MIKSYTAFGRKNNNFWERGREKRMCGGYFIYIHTLSNDLRGTGIWLIFSLSFCFLPFFSFPSSLSHFIFFFSYIYFFVFALSFCFQPFFSFPFYLSHFIFFFSSYTFWIKDFIFLLVIFIIWGSAKILRAVRWTYRQTDPPINQSID